MLPMLHPMTASTKFYTKSRIDGKITSSPRKGMRHYQSTLTWLDMRLDNQSQRQIWKSDGMQRSQNK